MTKEEAIRIWRYVKDHPTYDGDIVPIIQEACDMAIKALEQESILDKIREEIDEISLSEPIVSMDGLICYGTKSITVEHFRKKVFEVIDKYKAESEEQHG